MGLLQLNNSINFLTNSYIKKIKNYTEILFKDMHEELHEKKPMFYLEEHIRKLLEFGIPSLLKSGWTPCMFMRKSISFPFQIALKIIRIYVKKFIFVQFGNLSLIFKEFECKMLKFECKMLKNTKCS